MHLLQLLSQLAQRVPGVGLAEGLMGANHIFNAQTPQQIQMNGQMPQQPLNPQTIQGQPEQNWMAAYNQSGNLSQALSRPGLQMPSNIPIGGFQPASNPQQFAPQQLPMNTSDFRDTQIQVPHPALQVNNRPNNQQIRI